MGKVKDYRIRFEGQKSRELEGHAHMFMLCC